MKLKPMSSTINYSAYSFGGIGDSPANRIRAEVPQTSLMLRLVTTAFDDVSIPLNPSRPLNEPRIQKCFIAQTSAHY